VNKSQSLFDNHPDIAAMAHGWDPRLVSPHSKKKLEFICKFGHTWLCVVGDMTLKNLGCPYCSGKRALAGFNDLATINPELAAQADGWDPSTVRPGSSTSRNWKCALGHIWSAPAKRRTRGEGCPVCAGKRALAGFNDLATINPELAAQADGWDPSTVTEKSGAIRSWKCRVGHTWSAQVAARSNGNGCPSCSGRMLVAGENDVASRCPNILEEVDGWDPTKIHAGSDKKVAWRCKFGHNFKASPKSRSKGSGCPVCSGNEVRPGVNDLLTLNPNLARQVLIGDPSRLTVGSREKPTWKCDLGHEWKATVANRSKGQGCPACAGKKVLAGFNDLATINPELAAQADGWDPSTVTEKSGAIRSWKCRVGHTWKTRVATRSNGVGCPICSNHQLLVGYNDLATTNPDIAAEADGWDPRSLIAGTEKKQHWICTEGHRWFATVKSRAIAGTGCPSCARFGFDPVNEGWYYLVYDEDRDLFQIGITNVPKQRLRSHKRNGFIEVLDIRGPMDGHLTQHLEIASINALKNRGAIFGDRSNTDRFDGYTEAWTKASLDVTSISQILEWVYEDEAKSMTFGSEA
jgi:hypothetical protein